MTIGFLATVCLGCGSSNDFVVTGDTTNPGAGSLTFRFVRAQAVQEVPQSTTTIRFDWLGANSAVLRTDSEPFAGSITLVPPAGTSSVRITPLTSEGFPLLTLTGAVAVPPNGTNLTVDLSTFAQVVVNLTELRATPDPVSVTVGGGASASQQLALAGTFSNGEAVSFPASAVARATFTPDNSGHFLVSDTGLVTAVSVGSGSLSVSFVDPQGNTASDVVVVNVAGGGPTPASLVVTPDPLVVAPGSTSGALTATYTPEGGTAVVLANSEVDFSVTGSGFSVSANGTVAVANNVPLGTTTTLTATYSDNGGETLTDTITVTVALPTVVSRQFMNPSGDLELPVDFTYNLAASETYSDGSTRPVYEPEGLGYSFGIASSAVASLDANTLETASSAGNTTVTLSYQGEVVDSFTLTVSETSVTGIEVSPESFLLTPSSIVPYSVVATYANGRTADIAASPLLRNFPLERGLDFRFQDGLVYGGVQFANVTQTFSLTTPDGDRTDDVAVEQVAGVVTELRVTAGGLTSGQVPEGLTAVVDVHATLTDGSVRRLAYLPAGYGSGRSGRGGGPEFRVVPQGGDADTFVVIGNQLQPGSNHAIGRSESFVVSPAGGYVLAPGASSESLTLRVVSSEAGSAAASFTHYSDDSVLLKDLGRPVTVAFSNAFVEGFLLAGRDLTLAGSSASSTGLSVDEDRWGFPLLDDLNEASVAGFRGAITYEVRSHIHSERLLATAVQTVRIFEITAEPTFVPASLILNPGQTRSVDVQVSARESQGAPTQVFTRTLDFLYEGRRSRDNLAISNGSLDVGARGYGGGFEVSLLEYDGDRLEPFLSVTVRPNDSR